MVADCPRHRRSALALHRHPSSSSQLWRLSDFIWYRCGHGRGFPDGAVRAAVGASSPWVYRGDFADGLAALCPRGSPEAANPADVFAICRPRGSGTDRLRPQIAHQEGTRQRVAVMFSDVRNFTSYSEQNSPNLVGQMRQYLTEMTEAVQNHHGVLDKFIPQGREV